MYGTTDKVIIHLHTQREGDSLLIEISNPFDEDMQPAEGSGFGLSGLKRRLYLLYSRNDLLTTRIEESKFIVRLILPEKYDWYLRGERLQASCHKLRNTSKELVALHWFV